MLPYPSDVFRVEDPEIVGGFRIRVEGEALPVRRDGTPTDLLSLHPTDGFSPGSQILVLFPGGVDPGNLVHPTRDPERSLEESSPTVLLEAETGRRILHFAELDPRAGDDARRGLLIRPLERLGLSARYVVAIRGLVDRAGAPVVAPRAFAAIRDRRVGGHPVVGPVARRFERDVFPVLADAGVDRSGLQLAWDFTTASEENLTRDLLRVRDDLLARLDASPPPVTILRVRDDVDEHVFRRIQATVRVPLYVGHEYPGARLRRDDAGNVVAVGEADVPFTVHVPRSLATGGGPGRLLQYGHGFFGFREEAGSRFPTSFADRFGYVIVAADWWGMEFPDQIGVGLDIAFEPELALRFTDRLHQGFANFLAVADAAMRTLPAIPEVRIDGRLPYDPSRIHYYGISQGGILGGTYAALSPHVDRAVLGVGGACFPFMMFRAKPFELFLSAIELQAPDPLDQQKAVVGIQGSFDRIDPLTYAHRVLADPFPGSPVDRQVLMQIGIGDAQVPNLASHLHARAMGIPHLGPAPREIPRIDRVEGDVPSALVEFDFGIDPPPGISPPRRRRTTWSTRESAASTRACARWIASSGPAGGSSRPATGPATRSDRPSPGSPGDGLGGLLEQAPEHPGRLLVDLEALGQEIGRGLVVRVLDRREDGPGGPHHRLVVRDQ